MHRFDPIICVYHLNEARQSTILSTWINDFYSIFIALLHAIPRAIILLNQCREVCV